VFQALRDDIRQLVALLARSSRPSQGEGEINRSVHRGADGVFSSFTPRGLTAPACGSAAPSGLVWRVNMR
jgi:hypothetical protein